MVSNQLTTVIVDDEKNNAELLYEMLSQFCNDVKVVGLAYSVKEGVDLISKEKPDVIFLDIMMNDGSGFDLLDQLNDTKTRVIFTTAHEEFALNAIKACAIDYLLKPLSLEEVLKSVKKVIELNQSATRKENESINQLKKLMAFPTQEGILFKSVEEVVWVEGSGSYSKVTFVNGEHLMLSKNIGDLEKKLGNKGFFRIHNSFIVNINQVREYKRSASHNLVMSDGVTLTISRRRRDDFFKLMVEN